EVIVGGSASLQLMYNLIATAFTHGLLHSPEPWSKRGKTRFLCPAPGYDRHFRITEFFGMELIPIAMTDEGPDMDAVLQWIKDPTVLGIWCVPKYSNPDGIIYSNRVIHALASMKPAAPDFALMWDNAYCIHEFDGDYVPFPDILKLCAEYGNADMVYEFASTSKVTFPGAGISCMCASEANIAYFQKTLGVQIISFDKVNQLRHVRFLKDKPTTLALMKKHAEILKPRFAAVCDALDREIVARGIGHYNRPKGGYFVSLYAMPQTAKRTLQLVKEAGVTMTPAGATYPYGQDPFDSNIRIAPTLPPVEELTVAIDVFCLCLRIAALEQLLKAAA
ncbi:MAG: aminotransferase class I/II-fold pyridoxal phosphate-dependent enzyme, partial [Clostridia bacterium]|nr:aminotransferase class I/II-fold pyridoxal phosphate-dependent enzyme [Clostridia bacterium]